MVSPPHRLTCNCDLSGRTGFSLSALVRPNKKPSNEPPCQRHNPPTLHPYTYPKTQKRTDGSLRYHTHGERDPSRAAFRALIRSRTSGFTFTGPQEGPCPTINSLATRNDLSRAWNTGAALPTSGQALPASGQARAVPAAAACAARFAPSTGVGSAFTLNASGEVWDP